MTDPWQEVNYIQELEEQRDALLTALIYARSIVAHNLGENTPHLPLIDKAIARGENKTELPG